ncbi:MAG: methenyltetrahydromethanopterin cyclohydrolase [Halobacteriales archaeon]
MEPLNRTAAELVDEAIDFADELRIDVHHLDNEAVVLDFGVEAAGGLEAGLLLAEIRTGGLATVATRQGELAGDPRPYVDLSTDHPALALGASRLAGWSLPDGLLGSGPAGLLRDDAAAPDGAPEETFDFAVLAVEGTTLPDEALAEHVAGELDVPTAGTFLPTASAASVAGATARAADAAAAAIRRLEELGADPGRVLTASGTAPLPPVAADEPTARARAADAVAYAGRAHLLVGDAVDRADALPFGATEHAGPSFEARLADGAPDSSLPDGAVAPAAVTLDVPGEPSVAAGEPDEARLADAWGR